tara:strand:- start:824 stop:1069 length:246 start_codon:yes stop_codon:yes gene_type:complete
MTQKNKDWWVYIVKYSDASMYTGITTDRERRMSEHNGDSKKGAKYTRSRRPVNLVYSEIHYNRSMALKREGYIKIYQEQKN